jgi:hypothetical protein
LYVAVDDNGKGSDGHAGNVLRYFALECGLLLLDLGGALSGAGVDK